MPYKIDIGAVFSLAPKDHQAVKPAGFVPVERELVFDVDMSDYPRRCCTGAQICPRCWPYMTVAVKVMDELLRQDFGFRNLMWVYSGRRGVHCWVGDERARRLSNDARQALVDYCAVYLGNETNRGKSAWVKTPLLPFLQRAYDGILLPYFSSLILGKQGMFDGLEGTENLLSMVPSDKEAVAARLREQWTQAGADTGLSSEAKWAKFKEAFAGVPQGEAVVTQVVITYVYPRLDVNVSKGMNHLLKSPFCVHPGTGNVCVAFDGSRPESFDPFDRNQVPHVADLARQVSSFDKAHEQARTIDQWKKTGLKTSVGILADFVRAVTRSVKAAESSVDW